MYAGVSCDAARSSTRYVSFGMLADATDQGRFARQQPSYASLHICEQGQGTMYDLTPKQVDVVRFRSGAADDCRRRRWRRPESRSVEKVTLGDATVSKVALNAGSLAHTVRCGAWSASVGQMDWPPQTRGRPAAPERAREGVPMSHADLAVLRSLHDGAHS